MKKYVIKIMSLFLAVMLLCSCGRNGDNEETKYEISNQTTQEASTDDSAYSGNVLQSAIVSAEESEVSSADKTPEKDSSTRSSSDITASVTNAGTTASVTNAGTTGNSLEGTTDVQANMLFSDSPDNKYIKAVVKKYGVKAENLAAIYTDTSSNANTVLEFDGTKDENGKLIRTKNTLIGIYSVDDSDMSIICASLDEEKTEHSKTNTVLAFYMVIQYMLPEYEDELMG